MQPKTFAILSAIMIAFIVIEAIRRQKMTFKYSIFWLGTCALVLFFSFYDKLLATLSSLFGFALPSNFVFFLLVVFFIILSLLLTIYINEQNTRTETLAQTIALLECKIKDLESKNHLKP